jgi:hypothetical protein
MDEGASKIAAQRAKLAVTSVPAEAGALIAAITENVIAQRRLQGTMLDDKAKVVDAGAQVDAANAVLARCKSRVAAVQAAVTAADTDKKQRDALKTAIAAPPFLTIAKDASDLLGSLTTDPVKTRLEHNFSAPLLSIAQKRYATRIGRVASLRVTLTAAQDALANDLDTDNGLGGKVQKTWLDLQRAQAALADQVATIAVSYAKAKTLYDKLNAINPPAAPDLLTDAEKASRQKLDATGEAAVPNAEALDTQLKGVFSARDAVDAAVLAQIASDVDQLPASTTVADKRAEANDAQSKFDADLHQFSTDKGKDLDQWEAIIPDPVWSVLLDYEDSVDALTTLKTIDLKKLASDLDAAEDAYVTALADAEKAQRRSDALADAVALSAARLAAAQAAIGGRLASAIRGDTY